jgi:hypothetical protein
MSLRSRIDRVFRQLGPRGPRDCRCKGVQQPFAVWYPGRGEPRPVVQDATCEHCGGVLQAILVCVDYKRAPMPDDSEDSAA